MKKGLVEEGDEPTTVMGETQTAKSELLKVVGAISAFYYGEEEKVKRRLLLGAIQRKREFGWGRWVPRWVL